MHVQFSTVDIYSISNTKIKLRRDKFGFTFVICARENKAAAILAGLDSR